MSVLARRVRCACPVDLPCECSYPTLLRAEARAVAARSRREPLLHNGHLLAASSVLAAGLGSLFWMLATRSYSAADVGRSYAALSATMFLSTLGSLNLGDALVRFVPTAGRRTRALVLHSYLVSIAASAVVAVAFLLLIPVVAPDLAELRRPVLAVSFVAATAGYSVFVLQDGALTGVRRAGWVLGENTVFAVAKAALLALCAAFAVGAGILLSWAAALVLAIVLTNVVLFRRAIPAHQAAPVDEREQRPTERIARWAGADYLGNLFSFAAASVLPLMVLDRLGAAGSAYYSLAYVIASTLYVAAFSMGHSLVVEGSRDPARLAEHSRRLLRHSTLLVTAAAVPIAVAAPWILALFGPEYAEHGTTALRLMALSAIPNTIPNVAIQVARVRRSLPWMVGIRFAFALVVIALTAVLLPPFGLTGIGAAWLIAECALALPLLAALPRLLHPAPAPGRPRPEEEPT
ncbi:lipopolysaccharide biosynthesis protein [Kitasatospora phosalacinea]|uniref:lipopolysaccharide biosynthesis protein n=1 Tax=Kitasatospora phosalacinea TaxID=2065 RepID=UPI00366A2C84